MDLLKKLLLALAVTVSMGAVSTTVSAAEIEHASASDVKEAIDETIAASEETLAAIKAGAEKADVLALMKKAKLASKRIDSNPVDRLRSKGHQRMVKARSAIKKGNTEKAIELVTESVSIYKEVAVKFASL